MERHWRAWQAALVGILVSTLVVPLPIPAAAAPAAAVGTARGARGAEISFDRGRTWLPLGGRPFPLPAGSQVRTTTGAMLLDLADGSRIYLLPFSAATLEPAGGGADLGLRYGRAIFRLPASARTAITTPTARLEPAGAPAAGELFAGGDGTTGVKMSRGSVRLGPLSGAAPALVSGREPAFVPERPTSSGGPFFSSDIPATPPAGARAVFGPSGENVGYLRPDGQLIVQPGYAADLTRPLAEGTVRRARARIPAAARRAGALPLFDVNGAPVGYVSGPVFYTPSLAPPSTVVPAAEAAGAGGATYGMIDAGSGLPWYYYGAGVIVLVGGGVGIAAAAGAFDSGGDDEPATPVSP